MATHTQIAFSSSLAVNTSAMADRKIETLGFRPTPAEEALILAAENATGRNRSELLRRCLRSALEGVVDEILRGHSQAVMQFRQLAKAEPHTIHDSPVTYRTGKHPPKHKAG